MSQPQELGLQDEGLHELPPTEHPLASTSASGSAPALPSSPPSSAGSSSKRPAPPEDDAMAELVRKAKASRYAQPPVRKSSDENIADIFEQNLSCAICSEILVHPVLLTGCLHNFCGSCITPWLERTNTCPNCRSRVKSVGDNHTIANLIESLLARLPDKRRDAAELAELAKIYKPGQNVHIEESDPANEDEDDQDDSEPEINNTIAWPPCPCCLPGNPYGHECPDPIPESHPPHRADVYGYRNHVSCPACHMSIPTTWRNEWKCASCATISCDALFECPVPDAVVLSTAAEHLSNSSLGDFTASFRGNMAEIRRFEQWMADTGTSTQDVGRYLHNFLVNRNNGAYPARWRPVACESVLCKRCARAALPAAVIDWWVAEKGTRVMDARQKCWYGWGCRTQFHNAAHAEKLQHCCGDTPENGRRGQRAAGHGSGDAGPNQGQDPNENQNLNQQNPNPNSNPNPNPNPNPNTGRLDVADVVGPVIHPDLPLLPNPEAQP